MSQTIYFNDPSDITTIQTQVSALQNDAGFGQSLSSNVQTNMNLAAAAVANTHFGAYIHGGNVKSGQSFFASNGICNNNTGSNSWSPDTIYSWASGSKILTGLICAKMMEEGLLKSTDKCSSYYPAMSGTGIYYTKIDINDLGGFPVTQATYTGTFPYNPASYTATTGAFLWQDITINDLIHYNLGIFQDAFAIGAAELGFQDPNGISLAIATNYKANLAGTPNPSGLGVYLQFISAMSANLAGSPFTLALQQANSGDPTTVFSNANVDNFFNNNKNGLLICANKPGTVYQGTLPYGVSGIPPTYDSAYAILGVVLDRALRLKGYASGGYAQYARAKFFTPLGMNDAYVLNQESIPSSKWSRMADNSWRRAPSLGLTQPLNPLNPATWAGWGVSPQYQIAAGISGTGPLVWNSQYPNDAVSKFSNLFLCKTGAASNYPFGNIPLISSIADLGKLIQMVANRGLYNGQRIIKTETWNYLVQPKIQATTTMAGYPYPIENTTFRSSTYCLGLQRYNRDLSDTTMFGVDESTCYNGGFTGMFWSFDFYTGNWMIVGVPEIGVSSGQSLGIVGGVLYGVPIEMRLQFNDVLTALIN